MAANQDVVSCCSARPSGTPRPLREPARAQTAQHAIEQCVIPAGTFAMGDAKGDGRPADEERPVHMVELESFAIDATSVTNVDFARFVDETGYRTDAEELGSSAVFHLVVAADAADVLGGSPRAPWWWSVRGADWRHPDGPLSDLIAREDHPVVHISWNDARAYCRWARRRLPTEEEWERASRGGLSGARFPWGDEVVLDGVWQANIWQGLFPTVNTQEDGWVTTAPVRSYIANGYGLWQTVGNVWEWCEDLFEVRAYASRATGGPNPSAGEADGPRVLRGGSYLCHDSYCNRYRNAARSANTTDSSMGNAGFRTVAL
jgi:formylglycine-generating enzyme required for sulfatase activity